MRQQTLLQVVLVVSMLLASTAPGALASQEPPTPEDVGSEAEHAAEAVLAMVGQIIGELGGGGEPEENPPEEPAEAEEAAEEAKRTPRAILRYVALAQRNTYRVIDDGQAAADTGGAMSLVLGAIGALQDVLDGLLGEPESQAQGEDSEFTTMSQAAVAAGGNPVAMLIIAAGTSAAIGLWYALRRFVPFGLVPMLSRIARSDLYKNDARRLVADLVSQDPGICLHDLVKETGYSRNAISYHLFVLEKEGYLVSVKDGKFRRYFQNGGRYVNGAKKVVSVLKNHTTLEIAQYVASNPGAIQRQLCTELGTTPSAACWHTKRLVDAGVIEKQRRANTVEYYPGPSLGKYDLSEFGLAAASA